MIFCSFIIYPYVINSLYFQSVEGSIRAGKVDCQEHQYLCQRAGIGQYPTLRFYKAGRQVDYWLIPLYDIDYKILILSVTEKRACINIMNVIGWSNSRDTWTVYMSLVIVHEISKNIFHVMLMIMNFICN